MSIVPKRMTDVDVGTFIVQYDKTALVAASTEGHLEVVQVLLAAGANTEARGDVSGGAWEGCTLCMEGHFAVV